MNSDRDVCPYSPRQFKAEEIRNEPVKLPLIGTFSQVSFHDFRHCQLSEPIVCKINQVTGEFITGLHLWKVHNVRDQGCNDVLKGRVVVEYDLPDEILSFFDAVT